MSEQVEQSESQPSPLLNALFWWVMGLGCACLLALAAAQLPVVFRKLGLFGIAYGLVLGALLAWQTQTLGVSSSKFLLACIGGVILLSQLAFFAFGYYQWRSNATPPKELESLMIAQMKSRMAQPDQGKKPDKLNEFELALEKQASRQRADWEKSRTLPGYTTTYVVNRLKPLGDVSVEVGLTAWIAEILLGTIAGMFFASRLLKRDDESPWATANTV